MFLIGLSFQSKENASPHEDYGHKAMEYFRERIEQYGDCTAVPIRSLLGEVPQQVITSYKFQILLTCNEIIILISCLLVCWQAINVRELSENISRNHFHNMTPRTEF